MPPAGRSAGAQSWAAHTWGHCPFLAKPLVQYHLLQVDGHGQVRPCHVGYGKRNMSWPVSTDTGRLTTRAVLAERALRPSGPGQRNDSRSSGVGTKETSFQTHLFSGKKQFYKPPVLPLAQSLISRPSVAAAAFLWPPSHVQCGLQRADVSNISG